MPKFKKVPLEGNEQIPGEYMYVNTHPRKKGGWWKSKTVSQKIFFILSLCLIIASVVSLVLIIFARNIFGNEFADAIYGTGVENGFVFLWLKFLENGFRLLYTLLTILFGFVIGYFLDLFIRIVSSSNKKAVTTGSIIRSLVKYAVVIIGVGIILTI